MSFGKSGSVYHVDGVEMKSSIHSCPSCGREHCDTCWDPFVKACIFCAYLNEFEENTVENEIIERKSVV